MILLFRTLLLTFLLLPLLVMASEDGQTCTLIKNSKVIQLMPPGTGYTLRRVNVPEDILVKVSSEIPLKIAINLNKLDKSMNWLGGNIGMIQIDFGYGKVPILIMFKNTDVKDCAASKSERVRL